MAEPLDISTISAQEFQFIHTLINTLSIYFTLKKKNGQSNQCEVISHYSFDFHFLITMGIEHIFIYQLVIYVSSLKKGIFKSFSHFNWVICFCYWVMSSLNILDINILLNICFTNIFTHFIPHFLTPLIASFIVQKVF